MQAYKCDRCGVLAEGCKGNKLLVRFTFALTDGGALGRIHTYPVRTGCLIVGWRWGDLNPRPGQVDEAPRRTSTPPISERRSAPVPQRMLAAFLFVDAVEEGGRVLLEDKDKTLKELVLR